MLWLSSVPMQHDVFTGSPRWTDNNWVHTRVMNLFGDLSSRTLARRNANVLYRVEPGIGNGRVLVQSTVLPLPDDIEVQDLSKIVDALADDRPVRFLLKINAVKTVNRTKDGKLHRQRAVVPEEDIEAWVTEKLRPALSITDIESIEVAVERQRKTPIAVALVSGTARVANQTELKDAIEHGVGKARAFGCGLLSTLPIG